MHSHHLLLPLLLLALSLLPLSTPHNTDPEGSGIDNWCATTPHPEPCRYFLPRSAPPKRRSDFYRLSVQVAYDLALRAQSHLKHLGPSCTKRTQKTAWLDCWKLYANTLLQLNRTLLNPSLATARANCTPADAQTWLSAALTNLETCRKGFAELKADSDVILPINRYNVSDLVSNCLAINGNETLNVSAPTARGRSPSWAAAANRRLLQLSAPANMVVAKDGSGNYGTIKAALDAAARQRSSRSTARIVIHVKAGVYNENVQIVSSLNDITMVGDGKGKTIITGSRSVAGGYTTFSSPTFSVFGDGFMASGITFRNTNGPGSQAVALLSGSDQSIFYQCSFEGYQDTLCVFSQRQFYRECDIYGTIDFIFGNAAAVIQKCNIYLRKPRQGEANVITAQGRTDPNQNTGIVIQSSTIGAAPEFWPVHRQVKSFLGRPWQQYSRTVYLQNYIGSVIDPSGWLPFNGNFALDTLYYAEFKNYGPGSQLRLRVKWKGYKVVGRASQVRQFTVSRFIAGRSWIPATGVPFTAAF